MASDPDELRRLRRLRTEAGWLHRDLVRAYRYRVTTFVGGQLAGVPMYSNVPSHALRDIVERLELALGLSPGEVIDDDIGTMNDDDR